MRVRREWSKRGRNRKREKERDCEQGEEGKRVCDQEKEL